MHLGLEQLDRLHAWRLGGGGGGRRSLATTLDRLALQASRFASALCLRLCAACMGT